MNRFTFTYLVVENNEISDNNTDDWGSGSPENIWRRNSYTGPWTFTCSILAAFSGWPIGRLLRYRPDVGSTLEDPGGSGTGGGGQPLRRSRSPAASTVCSTPTRTVSSGHDDPGCVRCGRRTGRCGTAPCSRPRSRVRRRRTGFLFGDLITVGRLDGVDTRGDVTFPDDVTGGSAVAITRAADMKLVPAGYYLRLDLGAGEWRVYYHDVGGQCHGHQPGVRVHRHRPGVLAGTVDEVSIVGTVAP